MGESQGILPSTEFSSHRPDYSLAEILEPNTENCEFIVQGSEIPNGFDHQSNGNSISFMVGWNWRFPYPFAVCVALGPTNGSCDYVVDIDINGCLEIRYASVFLEKSESSRLWFFFGPLCEWENELSYLNLSKQSHFKVTHRIKMENCYYHRELMDSTAMIKKLGVHVECICSPHKSSLPLLPLFPSSCNEGDIGHANAMETTNTTGFEYDLKGFQGELNMSLLVLEFANDDFDFNLCPPWKKKRTS